MQDVTSPQVAPDEASRRLFWVRPGLEARAGRLVIAGRDAEELGRGHGTPLYAFDLLSVDEHLRALRGALERTGMRTGLRFAMKAHHAPEVLAVVRALGTPGGPGSIGIDACSPAEVVAAIDNGFLPEEISHTGTNTSDRDFRTILKYPGVRTNVDLISQIERLGRLSPGRRIGLRLNPRAGAFSQRTFAGAKYAEADRPTKFGIYVEQLPEAVRTAQRHDLTIVTAHVHLSRWLLDTELPAFEHAIGRLADMAEQLVELGCPLEEVNVGGGLGLADEPGAVELDLDAYAAALQRGLGRLDVRVTCEPGEFFIDQAAILLAEVVTVEDRLGKRFVGLDTGWNVMCAAFVYHTPIEFVLCRAADAPRSERVTFAGNINEADDLFVSDYPFPDVVEGDVVAMLSVGGYNQSMSSHHCLRPHARAVYFGDRAPPA